LEARILALQGDLSMNDLELKTLTTGEQTRRRAIAADRLGMQRSRQSDASPENGARTAHE
jgi:hypothetical protein